MLPAEFSVEVLIVYRLISHGEIIKAAEKEGRCLVAVRAMVLIRSSTYNECV